MPNDTPQELGRSEIEDEVWSRNEDDAEEIEENEHPDESHRTERRGQTSAVSRRGRQP